MMAKLLVKRGLGVMKNLNNNDNPYSDAEKGDGQVLILGKPPLLNDNLTNSRENGRDY